MIYYVLCIVNIVINTIQTTRIRSYRKATYVIGDDRDVAIKYVKLNGSKSCYYILGVFSIMAKPLSNNIMVGMLCQHIGLI